MTATAQQQRNTPSRVRGSDAIAAALYALLLWGDHRFTTIGYVNPHTGETIACVTMGALCNRGHARHHDKDTSCRGGVARITIEGKAYARKQLMKEAERLAPVAT